MSGFGSIPSSLAPSPLSSLALSPRSSPVPEDIQPVNNPRAHRRPTPFRMSSSPGLGPILRPESPPHIRAAIPPPRHRARIQPGPAEVINLAEDVSDEDDVVFVREHVPIAQPRRLRENRRGILRNAPAPGMARPIIPAPERVAAQQRFERTLAGESSRDCLFTLIVYSF
jgi:hypothetical protein